MLTPVAVLGDSFLDAVCQRPAIRVVVMLDFRENRLRVCLIGGLEARCVGIARGRVTALVPFCERLGSVQVGWPPAEAHVLCRPVVLAPLRFQRGQCGPVLFGRPVFLSMDPSMPLLHSCGELR